MHFLLQGQPVGCRDGHDEVFLHDDARLNAGRHKIPPAKTDIHFAPENSGEGRKREVLAVQAEFYARVNLPNFPGEHSHQYVG